MQVDAAVRVEWFNSKGQRNFVRHELNDRRQNSVVRKYVASICAKGIVPQMRGECCGLMPLGEGPYRLLTWGSLPGAYVIYLLGSARLLIMQQLELLSPTSSL